MKMLRLVLNMALAATMFLQITTAKDHTVGSPGGSWDPSTNMNTWASSNKFIVGDTLVFQYSAMHNVFEVSKTDFESCSTSNPIMTDASGNTVVSLKTAGKRYFICGVPGHCNIGMKMEVDVNSANPPSSPKVSPSPPPPSFSTPSSPPPSPKVSPSPPPPSFSTPSNPPPSFSTPSNPSPSFVPKAPSFVPKAPSFVPKPPSFKVPASPNSKTTASPPPSKSATSPSMAPAPLTIASPYGGPTTPVGSPSLATTSSSTKIQPLMAIAIAVVSIAIHCF